MLFKNKKAVRFLGTHVVNLVITVIVIIILIYLGVKIYNLFTEKNELERAATQLEKIIETINKVQETKVESKIEIFSPEGWFLVTFPLEFPYGECRGKKECLCICKGYECDNNYRRCESFDFDVEVRGFKRGFGQRESGERYSYALVEEELDYVGLPSAGELTVSKEEKQISIYSEIYGKVDKGQFVYY